MKGQSFYTMVLGVKLLCKLAEPSSQQASLCAQPACASRRNGIVNKVEFLGLIPQKW